MSGFQLEGFAQYPTLSPQLKPEDSHPRNKTTGHSIAYRCFVDEATGHQFHGNSQGVISPEILLSRKHGIGECMSFCFFGRFGADMSTLSAMKPTFIRPFAGSMLGILHTFGVVGFLVFIVPLQ